MRAVVLAFVVAALSPVLAHADAADDPCTTAVIDPAVTPVRDLELDAQRSACVREEVFTRVLGHALVDAAGFHGVLAVQLELPYTRDPMDTRHASGQVAAIVTTRLMPSWFLHGRLGMLGMYASSLAGSESWFAVRGGSDVVWQFCRCAAVLAGAEVSAGWRGGFDHVLLRAGVHWNMHASDWRLRAGVGAPLGGDERTNAVLDVAIVHGL